MSAVNELLDRYLEGPRLLRHAIEGMSREQLVARPIAGKWSTLEVICHLADFDPIYADRIKRTIALDRPLLLAADESLFAARLVYQERDAGEELAVMEATRKALARILGAVPPESLKRSGVHSERGLVTVEELLASIVKHVQHHLPFIEEKRRALAKAR